MICYLLKIIRYKIRAKFDISADDSILDLQMFFGPLMLVLFNLRFFFDSQLEVDLDLIERIILILIIDLLFMIHLLLKFKYDKYEVFELMKRISY